MSDLDKTILENIKYRDSFRAQYYLTDLQNVVNELVNHIQELGCIDIAGITLELLQHLADELDSMILPVVVHDIHAHKQDTNNFSPQERYQKFFVNFSTKSWTNAAREIIQKYSFVIDSIKTYCHSTVENIKTCLNRLRIDANVINETFSIDANPTNLRQIRLSGSDRHRGGQTVLFLVFRDEHKLVYKNCDSTVDKALQQFIELLDLPAPYDIKTRGFITKNSYSWYEYVEHTCCNSMDEMRNYYKRSGSLLAILDTLNYCDGHCENLIAHKEYPYLIDCETLFQNFDNEGLEVIIGSLEVERSILFTGLIEKPDHIEKCDRNESCSAFQAAGFIQQIFQPVICNDHTDEIKIRFHWLDDGMATDESTTGPIYENLQNAPCLHKHAYTIESFLDEFIEGYRYTYQHIKIYGTLLLNVRNPFWHEIKMISSAREIVRTTLFYSMLIRRLQQPKFSTNREIAHQYLVDYLRLHSPGLNPKLVDYEIEELLQLNIPYFSHQPDSRDLSMGDNSKYFSYFRYSAVEQIRSNIEHASDNYCDRQIAILRNVIKVTSTITAHCKCYACAENRL